MISLPKSWSTYYHDVVTRSHNLIDHNIWEGLDKNRLNVWLRNFVNDEERYLSACLLDSLIYRSKPQTLSLMYELLYRVIPNTFYFTKPSGLAEVLFPQVMGENQKDPGIRFVAVRRKADPVTKSSFEILRYMKINFQMAARWMIEPSQIGDAIAQGATVFIFIDDFLGTGNQFCTMCEEEALAPLMDHTSFLYAPLVAHQQGIDRIKGVFHKISVCYVEWLSDGDSFFDAYFSDVDNSPFRAKLFYESMIEQRELILNPSQYYGYGALELSYGFEHGAPDNSLPLLWIREENWHPLLNR